MSKISVRLDPPREQKLQELFDFFGLHGRSISDLLREFIDESHKYLIVYKKSEPSQRPPTEQKQATPQLACRKRIVHNGVYFCVDKPPRMVELATLEICKVCTKRYAGTTETPAALPLTRAERLWQACPPEIRELIHFENREGYVEIKQIAYLDEEKFRKVSRWVMEYKGEWFSLGKESHFRIYDKHIDRQPSKPQRS